MHVITRLTNPLTTNAQGFYSFQALPVGTYEVDVIKKGFNQYRQTGLVLNVNSALVVDTHLKVGDVVQEVIVSSTAVHVDTTSTRMGDVITGKTMTSVRLMGAATLIVSFRWLTGQSFESRL